MSREYTNRILELADEGVLDKDTLITGLLKWMSESDVKEFYDYNYAADLEDIYPDPDSEYEDRFELADG